MWTWIKIGLNIALLIAVAYLGYRYIQANKEIGALTYKVKVERGAVKILAAQLAGCNQRAQKYADNEAKAYSQCQETAATSDSSAFKRGVQVGKLLGAKQCTEQQSSASCSPAASTWVGQPQSSTPASPPLTPAQPPQQPH